MTQRKNERTDKTHITAKTDKEEEMHCTKCGTFLGLCGPGTNVTVPCPKCKEPNEVNYIGKDLIVKRTKRESA